MQCVCLSVCVCEREREKIHDCPIPKRSSVFRQSEPSGWVSFNSPNDWLSLMSSLSFLLQLLYSVCGGSQRWELLAFYLCDLSMF